MESLRTNTEVPVWLALHADIRTDSYVILASFLAQPPSEKLLTVLQSLEWDGMIPEKLSNALSALRKAGHDTSLAAMKEEFDRLFVGMGCGELVPYASWYREKKIQSLTLALLRSDLISLGIIRKAENRESEDHAGSLCEIMALISQETGSIPYDEQARFFHRHIGSWMSAFFQDLHKSKSACFYRAVGLFGTCFLESEKEYLQKGIPSSMS